MRPPRNAFAHLNDQIAEFVNQTENRRLRPGTGYYSALFRGTLFGQESAADVAERLKTRAVEVLWLGTNPNVPRSLANIVHPPNDEGDYHGFEQQRRSGLFGSARWTEHGREPDWDPIHDPKRGWAIYAALFAAVARLDAVTMANFVPWGSAKFVESEGSGGPALLEGLGKLDQGLLGRVLEFCDGLNAAVVRALRPRLIAVPFGLGANRTLDRIHRVAISLSGAADRRDHIVPALARRFTYCTAWSRLGSQDVRTVHLPHPSSLRRSVAERQRIIDAVADTLSRLG